ncbi:hypothetical protein G7B40_037695 [Aetokthonos hydrillicola Thurmond2011]|jgi:hypothetical protein|uniref:Uncharacterized protein n=1 Tax=Aetokthonos hydrillicola Thurmond2011 TaxID=2712845 RepID=A0AAP5ME23_9CYAN|nr:hypothetical protein [Aetokthonos hydrillicola]MBO3461196.1 hypothetical protein [Aetokthonos hydrillicola CCALA 1050]MBW4589750.1 hypothetical protein [Aetokthonos hydrillicola CCALA 1050]MDR9900244.1 hypothetical protein [Aetokthonos hydrillicola Thurmond2011]
MNKNFDLTTKEGRQNAVEQFDRWGMLIPGFAPFWLMRQAFKAFSQSGVDTLKAQKEAAIELIKAGKENDVDEMTITVDQVVGLDLGSDIEGIPIKCKIGKSGHMIIEVKYKNT